MTYTEGFGLEVRPGSMDVAWAVAALVGSEHTNPGAWDRAVFANCLSQDDAEAAKELLERECNVSVVIIRPGGGVVA